MSGWSQNCCGGLQTRYLFWNKFIEKKTASPISFLRKNIKVTKTTTDALIAIVSFNSGWTLKQFNKKMVGYDMVKLKPNIIDQLASMICGDSPYDNNFLYRSSSYLTAFFRGLDLDYRHDGSTRRWWVSEVLEELNKKLELNEESLSVELKNVYVFSSPPS